MSNSYIQIADKKIGPGQPVFVIAEIGNNHNGCLKRAKELVDQAKEMGADCVKFQIRNLKELYREKTLKKSGDDLSTEYVLDLLNKYELSHAEHVELRKYSENKGLLCLYTPWDLSSVDFLEELKVEAYKVASADLTNLVLLERLANTKKPLILSTGMSYEYEIQKTIEFLNKRSVDFILLHCNSTYPAPFKNINLNYLKRLSAMHSYVGYSGHERGTSVTLGAVALGAIVVERHFTLDRDMEGPDHAASLEYKDFKYLLDEIRILEDALGDGKKRVSQGELMNRETLGKSLVASKDLKSGTIVKAEDVIVKSPGQGLSPQRLDELVGTKLKRDLEREDYFYRTDLEGELSHFKNFSFSRPWGVPVRYHDFKKFLDFGQPDLFEFHLSYADMELKISDFLHGTYDVDFVVHAPELFKNSLLMDLATTDKEILRVSIEETQRVIDITRDLKPYFPKTKKPLIVANIGGISRDGNLSAEKKQEAYDIFADSLKQLDCDGVELIPQTMAPFPWHFGGQRYQNLFVHHNEIAQYCQKLGLRICLDVSHSMLTCNHFGYSLIEFIEVVGPYIAHLHIGDAQGVDGEGLQVGEGDIDFQAMGEKLKRVSPKASFIPEIWQGHKNDGEGFWVALEKLEGLL